MGTSALCAKAPFAHVETLSLCEQRRFAHDDDIILSAKRRYAHEAVRILQNVVEFAKSSTLIAYSSRWIAKCWHNMLYKMSTVSRLPFKQEK
jgi:hypothetical protein